MSIVTRWSLTLMAAMIFLMGQQSAQAQLSIFDAAWDFEDSGNRFADITGNGHNLTLTDPGGSNLPTYIAPPAGNSAYLPNAVGTTAANFFGDFGAQDQTATNSGFRIPSTAYTGGDYTFIAVVRATTDNDGNGSDRHKTILDPKGGTGDGVRFQHRPDQQGGNGNNDNNRWVLDPGPQTDLGNNHITQNNWSILMLTRDGATGHAIYDNNSDAANPFAIEASITNTGIPTDFFIGTQGGQSDAFHGQIAFAGFINRLLTSEEQAGLLDFLNNGAAVPEPASVAIWTLLGLGGLGYCVYRRRRRSK